MQESARPPAQDAVQILKRDLFGTVALIREPGGLRVRRDTSTAPWWAAWLARTLARREARALLATAQIQDVPRLLSWDGRVLVRSWLEARPMQIARPRDPQYFAAAVRLVRQLHAAGVVHNDLAKEPNWLVLPDGCPALVDFQLAWAPSRRGAMFRLLAREDLRHTLKHKRHYCAAALSDHEREILENRAWTSRLWMASGKKVYLFVTRRLLGWADREGAGDRTYLASRTTAAKNDHDAR
jgi:RIO-like serine/threonine protein kinase